MLTGSSAAAGALKAPGPQAMGPHQDSGVEEFLGIGNRAKGVTFLARHQDASTVGPFFRTSASI